MTDLKIVCTEQVPLDQPLKHAHIVTVGVDVDNDGYADKKHSKQQVIDNIRSGSYRYFTRGVLSGKVAFVEVVACPHSCGMLIIRSAADSVKDNNLDYLRRCSWSK